MHGQGPARDQEAGARGLAGQVLVHGHVTQLRGQCLYWQERLRARAGTP